MPTNRARILILILAMALAIPAFAKERNRPKIFRISSVTFLTSDIPAARAFYAKVADRSASHNAGNANASSPFVVELPSFQSIQITKLSAALPDKLLANLTFEVDDIGKLAKLLKSENIEFKLYTGRNILTLLDPEGNRISFGGPPPIGRSANNMGELQVQGLVEALREGKLRSRGVHLIHAGFIVHDRAAMEHFYKDILGFRPYWHGGMKDDETNWVSLQVPDGSDWIEFMLNVPENADQRLRGIMNHIALGVKDIHVAQEQLRKNGAPLTEEPKIGRDGKWQLNLYDPDQTRIEFMEFTPVQKPCCSDFTAPHPKP
jgi:catechol 2,3-dioxygenase-like lactoylglutathione lyase family enzyme